MSRREKAKKESLEALARIANHTPSYAPSPPPPPPAPRAAPAPPTPARRQRPVQAPSDPLEGRGAKAEEARILRQRRANELVRGKTLEWRGMGLRDVPTSIRRTGFDIREPNVTQKIEDVLGAPREKDGRVKNREKGRRTK